MPPKNKQTNKIVGVLIVVLFLGIMIWLQFFSHKKTDLQTGYDQGRINLQEKFEAELYFIAPNTGELIREKRNLPKSPLLESKVKIVLTELILGPKTSAAQATIPTKTQLKSFYLDDQGCAYLDFDAEIKRNHPGGSYAELLTIAALVKTLTSNFPEIKQVKLLINGAEIDTLAGHIDTRYPFNPQNITLIPLPANS